jgi:hypothetical protein
MKRSISLAAILALGGLPVWAGAAAHLASTAAAYPAPTRVTTALTAGALDTRGLSSATEKTAVPTLLAICGMSVNNPGPPSTAGFGSANTTDISALKLAQCYFNGSSTPVHRTTPQIDAISRSFTAPAAGQRIGQFSARVAG